MRSFTYGLGDDKDYYTNQPFQEQFCRLEGTKIAMPVRFYPSQELLGKHRRKLA